MGKMRQGRDEQGCQAGFFSLFRHFSLISQVSRVVWTG